MKKQKGDKRQIDGAFLGLDVGATSLVLVLIDRQKNIIQSDYSILSEEVENSVNIESHRCQKSCEACFHPCNKYFITKKTNEFINGCCKRLDLKIVGFGATGSQVRKDTPFTIPLDMLASEIAAHGQGMRHASNTQQVQAIIDVGGQDSKVIRLSNPLEFHMSGLCAAGTGAYLDEISKAERIDVSEFAKIGGQYIRRYIESQNTDEPLNIEEFSSVCTVFTKSSYVKKKEPFVH